MGARIIRRAFLVRLGRAAGAGLLLPAAACSKKTEAPSKTPPAPKRPPVAAPTPAPALPEWAGGLKTFSPAQALCAETMLEVLLPSDVPPGSPGARETRVLLHLDRVLTTPAYQSYARLVRDGLDRLDREARKRHQATFAGIALADRQALLADWQVRSHRARVYPTARFFSLVFTFALEGYLGDPRHGGNHGQLAWRWIDFSPGCPSPSGHCGPGQGGHGGHAP